ncbi:E3 ubiquitin/ISG15 ligase TRIM25-like isoform X2 [Polypterus senegalus]|uniref:E3 ubiquitin/ISG15 ligase TRIM25-like isoform X2 n=1 Tax=Polypterus senegalus TaxID=55291 RepID=UPI00196248AB|nr:E3 ubiquitin/ISG15 ligase TRIM25-like isoform X2 [Polypterus senegalus]
MKRLSVSILHKHRSLVTVCHSGSPFTMAAARPLLSADQFTCSVCLDVLKKPVTIPCGHNYCLDCINDYWDQSDTVEVYLCPQCRRSFNVRPELNRNTVLAEIIEKLNEMQSDVAPSQSYAGPDDVPCDVCPGRKWRAVKTCLTCMASYCESHLQPHREFEALKKHKLGDPTGNLEEKICEKHQRVLEIFCRTDETCVCLLCVATEHKSHDTVTPEEERAGRQSQLDKEKKGLRKRIQETEKRLVEIKESVVKIQKSAKKELQNHEDTFNFLTQIIQSLRSKVTETVRDHEQKEVRKAEELMEQLEKEIKKLKKTSAELAQLSHTDDHIHFLKKFPSLCVPMSDGVSPKLTANSDFLPETLKKDLSELQRHLQEMSGWEFVKSRQTVKTPSCFQQNMSRNSFLQCPVMNFSQVTKEMNHFNHKLLETGTEAVQNFPDTGTLKTEDGDLDPGHEHGDPAYIKEEDTRGDTAERSYCGIEQESVIVKVEGELCLIKEEVSDMDLSSVLKMQMFVSESADEGILTEIELMESRLEAAPQRSLYAAQQEGEPKGNNGITNVQGAGRPSHRRAIYNSTRKSTQGKSHTSVPNVGRLLDRLPV